MNQVRACDLAAVDFVGRLNVAVVYRNGRGPGIQPNKLCGLAAVNADDLLRRRRAAATAGLP